MIKLTEAKELYPGEWIAFLIQQNGKNKEPSGIILDHDLEKRQLHKKLREKKIKDAYITFSGPIVKPGYEVLF